jgi:hypothetical protein
VADDQAPGEGDLRWFRLKVVLAGEDPVVSCWAEGLLRGGDGGMWGVPGLSPGGAAGTVLPLGPGEATRPMPGMAAGGDPWAQLRNLYRFSVMNPGGYLQQSQLERAWRQAMETWKTLMAGGANVPPPPPPSLPGVPAGAGLGNLLPNNP